MIRGIGVGKFDLKEGTVLIDQRPKDIADRSILGGVSEEIRNKWLEEKMNEIKSDAVEAKSQSFVLKRNEIGLHISVEHVRIKDPTYRGGFREYAILVYTDSNTTLTESQLSAYRKDFEERVSKQGEKGVTEFVALHAIKIAIDDLFDNRLPQELKEIRAAILKTDTGEILRTTIPDIFMTQIKDYTTPLKTLQQNSMVLTTIGNDPRQSLFLVVKASSELWVAFLATHTLLQKLLPKIPKYLSMLGADSVNVEQLVGALTPPAALAQPEPVVATGPQPVSKAEKVAPQSTQPEPPLSEPTLIKIGDTTGSQVVEASAGTLLSFLQDKTIPTVCALLSEERRMDTAAQELDESAATTRLILTLLKTVAKDDKSTIYLSVQISKQSRKTIHKELNVDSYPCIIVLDRPPLATQQRRRVFTLPSETVPKSLQPNALIGDVKKHLERIARERLTISTQRAAGVSGGAGMVRIPLFINDDTKIRVIKPPKLSDDETIRILFTNIIDYMPVSELIRKIVKTTKIDAATVKDKLVEMQKLQIVQLEESL